MGGFGYRGVGRVGSGNVGVGERHLSLLVLAQRELAPEALQLGLRETGRYA